MALRGQSGLPNDVAILWRSYHSFFDNLNTYIALLDPALHTPAYCLASSPILFLSILVVTSMVYASSLYEFFFNAANRILADSFATGHVSVGLCQSLSLLSVWKKPSDQNAWLRVGYAIRWVLEGGLASKAKVCRADGAFLCDATDRSAAYQLNLDAPPVRPLPSNAQEAREVLVSRLWDCAVDVRRLMGYCAVAEPREDIPTARSV